MALHAAPSCRKEKRRLKLTILQCDCGEEIFIFDEGEATAWQCDACGQWYNLFQQKVAPPETAQTPKVMPYMINWSAGEEL